MKTLRWNIKSRKLYSALQAHRALWRKLVENAESVAAGHVCKADVCRLLKLSCMHDCVLCQYAVEKSGCHTAAGFCQMCPGKWGDEKGGDKYHCVNTAGSAYWFWENVEDAEDLKEAAFRVLNTPLHKWNYGWSR